MRIALISHPDCLLHDMGLDHPECAQRLSTINELINSSSHLSAKVRHYQAPLVSTAKLLATHKKAYIDSIFKLAPQTQGVVNIDPDTVMNKHTLNAAQRAAGAIIYAVDLVMKREHHAAFCNIRPPGHHAEYARAMGFCFFNNIAVGVKHALDTWSIQRIAIIDFDVHHGNGTEDIFKDEPRVLLCSTFQHPLYPYTGVETQNNHSVNIPLAAGTNGSDYRALFKRKLIPKLDAFSPQLVFISAGFDGHKEDPLANLNLTEDDYAWITKKIKHIADKHAAGRIISSLEGGYALDALARSVSAHIAALCN